ncbi:MAG: (d)CMP kinase [Bacilli bacterium]
MSWQIAIDGPAGAGKSTIAKDLASRLGFEYVDTGAMYRAVTLKAMTLKINMDNEADYHFLDSTTIDFQNQRLILDGIDVSEAIRSLEISNSVSLVAKFGFVRTKLVALQQHLADSKNVIMDGRDIGTVVLPNAHLKIYLNATVEERARRRMQERLEKNQEVQTLEATIKEIEERDFKDSNRPISPLAKAADAIEIDSSKLSVNQVVEKIMSLVIRRGIFMNKADQTVEKKLEEVVEPKVEEVVEPKVEETVEVKNEEVAQVEEPVAIEKDEVVSLEEAPSNEAITEEKVEEEKTPSKYRELQVVEGKVIEVQEAKPEFTRNGKVVKAKEERVLIELEDGQQGFLYRKDTADMQEDEDLFDLFVEGDQVPCVIKKIYPDGGKFLFSTVLLKMRNDLKKFDEIIRDHGVFQAKVVKNVNVGYLLKYEDFTCLLPVSQVAVPEEEREGLIGQTIEVAPIRIDFGRIRLIVSQNVANAIRKRSVKKEFLDQIQVGQVFEGTIKNVETYGAFVELGNGVEGLLHISEYDHVKIFKLDRVVKPGDKVQVQVIKVENDHVGLSRKALIPNFWQEFTGNKEVGQIINGKVIEINNAGLVLELGQEVTGFLPKSEFAYERDVFITDTVNVGDQIDAKIIEIDASKRRIILSKKQLTVNPWDGLKIKAGDNVEVLVEKELKDGYKVALNGASGYLPKSNIFNFPIENIVVGGQLKVKVRVFDPERTRLVVGLKVETERVERESYNKFMKAQEKLTNNFGDLLANKFKDSNK